MGQRLMVAMIVAIVSAANAAAQTQGTQPAAAAASEKAVDLSTEPSRAAVARTPATLRDAAVANDYQSFAALVRKAKANGEDLGAYADLYEVWSFSESNATGAYYGAALHDRLASRYPDYAKFIAEYRIADRHGDSFYPSAETRKFLLQQAIDGNDPVVAPTTHTAAAQKAAPQPSPTATSRAVAPAVALASAAPNAAAAQTAGPMEAPETLPADALVSDMQKVEPQPHPPAARPSPAAAAMVDTTATTRGLFLIILGLIGIGVLTMTIQASASDIHVIDDEERPKPVALAPPHDAQPTESRG